MTIERRNNPRINLSGPVSMKVADEAFTAKLMNITPQGVQVELSQSGMNLLSSHRPADGSWPVTHIEFGQTIKDPAVETGIDGELVFSRRISQKIFIAGFRFIISDVLKQESVRLLVQSLLRKQEDKRAKK